MQLCNQSYSCISLLTSKPSEGADGARGKRSHGLCRSAGSDCGRFTRVVILVSSVYHVRKIRGRSDQACLSLVATFDAPQRESGSQSSPYAEALRKFPSTVDLF